MMKYRGIYVVPGVLFCVHGRRHRGGCRGHAPPRFEIPVGMSPPEIAIFKETFMHICENFQIFQYFQNKVAKIRGEIGIWG